MSGDPFNAWVDKTSDDYDDKIVPLNPDAPRKAGGQRKQQRSEGQQANGELALRAARLPMPETLDPRRWLYGTELIRGFVSVLVAPGGTGKSAYALALACSLAAGRAFLGCHIFSRVNVAVINLDDPMDELERRVAAVMLSHKIPREELEGRLFLEDCEGHRLVLAEQCRGEDGFFINNPDEEALIALICQNNIGLIVCDPFAESHTLEENSNPQMIQAAAVWRRIARATDCAVLLVHHVRKGTADGIDAARGAKAVTDSARVGLLMTTMCEAEADMFGIGPEDRLSYVRLDDAKRNMAPAGKARWFQLRPVSLGNTHDPLYPRGDSVGAIVPWTPPAAGLAASSVRDINAALDEIAKGPNPGILYSMSKAGRSSKRWCGNVLCDMLDMDEKTAKATIGKWQESGLLYTRQFDLNRKPTPGVAVNDGLRPT